jgi:hypothetical protein
MKYTLVFLLVLFLSFNVFSQEMLSGITYNMGQTLSKSKELVNDYSWRGFGFEVRNMLNDNFSVGGSFSWNIFDQRTGEIIWLENGAISGTQIRHINAFPLLLNAHYYIGNDYSRIRPYIGLNAGTYYILQRLEIGIFALENNNWHFGVAPEIGVIIPSGGADFIVNLKYNYAFPAGKKFNGEKAEHQYLGINVGFLFSYNAW